MSTLVPAEPHKLLALFDQILSWPKRSLRFSCDAPGRTDIHPRLRIAIIVEGRAQYWISAKQQVSTCIAGRGDMLVCLPWGHFRHQPARVGASYRMFTLVIWDTYVRILDSRGDETRWHHTSNPFSREGLNCAAALELLARREQPLPQALLITEAMLHIARDFLGRDMASAGTISKAVKTYRRICEHIAANFHLQINRDSVARALRVAPQHVSKLFARLHECGINEYIRNLRLRHAENLLRNPGTSIAEAAHASGFSSAGYFIRAFRQVYGTSPGVYRDRGEEDNQG